MKTWSHLSNRLVVAVGVLVAGCGDSRSDAGAVGGGEPPVSVVADGGPGVREHPPTPGVGRDPGVPVTPFSPAITPEVDATAPLSPLQPCIVRTCADFHASCGDEGDGCGGVLHCGTCTPPDTCGGGGLPSTCGSPPTCKARTCADVGATCGPVGDGCGALLNCGGCVAPELCGGGGVPSVCGRGFVATAGPDAGCAARSCADQGATCGPANDGCGNAIDCGGCTAPETCGGAGVLSTCGAPPRCVPKSCVDLRATCGTQGDGCGGKLSCGTCTAPQTCGGGGAASVCGGRSACVPRTCADAAATCGEISDGCGALIACGTCNGTHICGGGGVPNVCGGGTDNGEPPCVGLCQQRVKCSAGAVTTITGKVFAPAATNADPLYNAVVYIPNGPVTPFETGVSCDQCAEASGSPIASAITGPDGTFTLSDVPVGKKIPIVVQLGRWRRQLVIPTVTKCIENRLPDSFAHLPRNKSEGDIPQMAIVTGSIDSIECVLRKIGVEDSEFTLPSGTGRIHMYRAGDASGTTYGSGATLGAGTPTQVALLGSPSELNRYDMILLPCTGAETTQPVDQVKNIVKYTSQGGRAFVTHYSYTFLATDDSFKSTAQWNVGQMWPTFSDSDPLVGTIDQSFPKGQAMSSWLDVVGASVSRGSGTINIFSARHDVDGVIAPSQRWIYSTTPSTLQHFTFNTPIGADATKQCGRVVFSDFHVNNNSSSNGRVFPSECVGTDLTPQEKVLEFMMFDLASCITPDKPPPPPICHPLSCADQHLSCGPAGDGCGGKLQCGRCVAPDTCGGGGVPGACGRPSCKAATCSSLRVECGPEGDGCGGQLDCGPCASPQTCGGGGVPGRCGEVSCKPRTCAAQKLSCGPAGDGCGRLLDCGPCVWPETCGGAGVPGECGVSILGTCAKHTCADQQLECGPAGDGCGGLIDCGPCVAPETCGGGGAPGKCGAVLCTKRTCSEKAISCGITGDGCGGELNCGPCIAPETCGGGGVPGKCGCEPITCARVGAECGAISDRCGATLNCGPCASPLTCGGGGVPNRCGAPPH